MIMDRIALIISIIGALNWGSIGLFRFDIVAWLFGGQGALVSRIIYTIVGLAGSWCVSLLFRTREKFESLDELGRCRSSRKTRIKIEQNVKK